jgi:REP element-mobilizing transposase RayT
MTNHFHLLVETSEPNLSPGMQQLISRYARYFNERFAFEGHLFQQRFTSRLIGSERQYAEVLRYIALNPVRAGLCAHPSDWPWSTFFGRPDLAVDR